MADKSIGTAGTLRITDDGTVVRFYVLCGDPVTNVGEYRFAINGTPGQTSLPSGFGSRLLGSRTVTSSQTVSLSQQATGTQGLGGAAYFAVSIFRATVPPAPRPLTTEVLGPETLRYRFESQGTGGSPVTDWQAQIATDAAFTQGVQTVSSSGTSTFTDLIPATRYYFRSRGVNAVGTGPWSSALSATTDSGAYASINGVWIPVPVYASNGTPPWIVPALLASDGTTWENAV